MPETLRSNPWKIGCLILAIAMVLWTGHGMLVPRLFMDWEKSSQFGDMFGGIGALFSGLALGGVVVAIKMQKEELELQREELVNTREELRRSAVAQDVTSRAMMQQVQLMIAAAKLNAHTTLAEYDLRTALSVKLAGPNVHIENIQRLLGEINVMSTENDPPSGSR